VACGVGEDIEDLWEPWTREGAQQATRQGVEAWRKMQQHLRELAELNKERNLRRAREEIRGEAMVFFNPRLLGIAVSAA